MSEISPERSGSETETQSEHRPIPKVRFEPGELVVTEGADFSLAIRDVHPVQLFARHVEGDWGNVGEHQVMENEQSADLGGRIFSAYNIEDGRFYVITEADRSVTTILLPDEY